MADDREIIFGPDEYIAIDKNLKAYIEALTGQPFPDPKRYAPYAPYVPEGEETPNEP